MTKNRRAKQAARARAEKTGEPYSLAARREAKGSGIVLAVDLQAALADALRAQGWQVGQQAFPEFGEYTSFAAQAQIEVGRGYATGGMSGEEDPDDDVLYDLEIPPKVVVVWPFLGDIDGQYEGYTEFELSGASPVGQIVADINDRLSAARIAAVRGTRVDAECGICGDSYAAEHLAYDRPPRVCAACLLDGDLMGRIPDPFHVAAFYDEVSVRDPAFPPLWTAFAVLLACIMPSPDTVKKNWPGDPLSVVYHHWLDPREFSLWLPPMEKRIPALRQLGAAASVGAIVDAIEEARPDLREALMRERAEAYLENTESMDEAMADVRREYVAALWPAVVAYAVAAATQQAERPDQRGPWHYSASFEEGQLGDLLEAVGSQWDADDVHMTLHYSIGLADELGLGGKKW